MARKVNSSTPEKSVPKTAPHRFIVRSAAEAVQQVREKLGPNAQVVSVRQVKGQGLQRFLSSPRLEILACLPESQPQLDQQEVSLPQSAAEYAQAGIESLPPVGAAEPRQSQRPVATTTTASTPILAAPDELANSVGPAVLPRVQHSHAAATLTCGKFLNGAGFSDLLLARFSADATWRKICDLPLEQGLTAAIRWIRAYRERSEVAQLTNRVAFIGGPGSGKTTALCKILARDVFIRGLSPQVLQMEVDKPHLDDGLSMYCDVLGVPCLRSHDEVDFNSDAMVYVDFPGYSLRDPAEQDRVLSVLDGLQIDSRVLVLNAAYEASVLSRFAESGRRLGARFQVLTHVDEIEHVGKLWAFLLDTQRQLILLSNGQNVAGDRVDDVLGFLIERTFPS